MARVLWPAINANVGSKSVLLDEPFCGVMAPLAQTLKRAEPKFVHVAMMRLDVIAGCRRLDDAALRGRTHTAGVRAARAATCDFARAKVLVSAIVFLRFAENGAFRAAAEPLIIVRVAGWGPPGPIGGDFLEDRSADAGGGSRMQPSKRPTGDSGHSPVSRCQCLGSAQALLSFNSCYRLSRSRSMVRAARRCALPRSGLIAAADPLHRSPRW